MLTDDHARRYTDVRRLALDHLAPLTSEAPVGRVNRPLVAALADHGLLSYLFPARYGGSQDEQVSAVDLCLLREAVATESTEAETALAMQGLGAYPVLEAGKAAIADRLIPEVVAGRAVAAFALTEPGAGSDAAALTTQAEKDGDGFRITGEKTWISNAPEADFYTVFARTAPGPGSAGITAFVVEADTAGLTGGPIDLLAPHPIGSLTFDGVPVPADHVLGELGHGLRVALATLARFRPSVGAFAVGMAQAAFEATNTHVDARQAFGGSLRDLQVVLHRVASMAQRLHQARLTVYDAAIAFDTGAPDLVFRSSVAKATATETAQAIVDEAIQLHGARALEKGHQLEHLYREVRAPRIYEGATDVQFEVIGRELAKPPRS